MSQHISTLNYLRSADTCLTQTRTVIYWLSVPAITDSENKCHVFGGHVSPKSLAVRTLSGDRQFVQMSMLPSGDRKQYLISRANACVMNDVIVASQTSWLLSVLRHHVVKLTTSVLNPRYRRRERFSVLTCAHCEERLLSSWCRKTQIARIEANRVATWSLLGGMEFGRPA